MRRGFATTSITYLFLSLLSAYIPLAYSAQTVPVVPGGLANVEGNSSSLTPFGLGGSYFQQVFSASEFASLGAPTGRIDSIRFRLDASAGQNMVLNLSGGLEVFMSTTTRSPDGLSPTFGENESSDGEIVFMAGPNLPILANYVPGATPQPFGLLIPLQHPFFYVPSMGNLLLSIRTSGGMTFNPVALDAQLTPADGISSVFASSELATSGTLSTLGLATRFDIAPIPEPPSSLLILIAVLALAGLRCCAVSCIRAYQNQEAH